MTEEHLTARIEQQTGAKVIQFTYHADGRGLDVKVCHDTRTPTTFGFRHHKKLKRHQLRGQSAAPSIAALNKLMNGGAL